MANDTVIDFINTNQKLYEKAVMSLLQCDVELAQRYISNMVVDFKTYSPHAEFVHHWSKPEYSPKYGLVEEWFEYTHSLAQQYSGDFTHFINLVPQIHNEFRLDIMKQKIYNEIDDMSDYRSEYDVIIVTFSHEEYNLEVYYHIDGTKHTILIDTNGHKIYPNIDAVDLPVELHKYIEKYNI